MVYVVVTECQAKLTQVFSYGIVYLHFYEIKKWNYTNFERNLAMMVTYVPVKFEFDWTHRFRVRVRKRKCGRTDERTDKRTKNGQMNGRNYTNFERNLAMMVIYHPVKFEFDWTDHFRVRVRKRKMWTDRWTSDTSI